MKAPSRLMPTYPSPQPVSGWIVGAVLLFVSLPLAWFFPWAVVLIVAVVAGMWFADRLQSRKLAVLASQRGGLSICSFARSFNTKTVDTWVIRAVYEDVQKYVNMDKPDFPVAADDRLFEDLLLDEDDLEVDIVEAIAFRTGRSLENCESNPHWGTLQTVGDLVLFFNAQPFQADVISPND